VRGRAAQAAAELDAFSGGVVRSVAVPVPAPVLAPARFLARPGPGPTRAAAGADLSRPRLSHVLRDRRMLRLLAGTAGSWFVLDYAYYGNTLSLPVILKSVDPGADLAAKLTWSLAMFVVFAVPGYALAIWWMDRIGHRRLQLVGFGVPRGGFFLLAAVPVLTASVGAFIAIFGLSYLFVEFGPNTTTFVLPSGDLSGLGPHHGARESQRASASSEHFSGSSVVPALETRLGLRPMLAIAAGSAVVGIFADPLASRSRPPRPRKTLGGRRLNRDHRGR